MRQASGHRARSVTIVALLVALPALGAAWYAHQEDGRSVPAPVGDFAADSTTLASCSSERHHARAIDCRGQALGNVTLRDGADAALAALDRARVSDPVAASNCHWLAHWIGRAALVRAQGHVGRAMGEGSELCVSGYYHGVLDRVLVDVPERDVDGVITSACTDPVVRFDDQLRYACVHGVGHALVVRHGSLTDAAAGCRLLRPARDADDCVGGGVMEHFARAAERAGDQPRDAVELARACEQLGEQAGDVCHRGVGYALATRLDDARRATAARGCLSLPTADQSPCATAAGETIAEEWPHATGDVVAACRAAGTLAIACMRGAGHSRAVDGRSDQFCAGPMSPALRDACRLGAAA